MGTNPHPDDTARSILRISSAGIELYHGIGSLRGELPVRRKALRPRAADLR